MKKYFVWLLIFLAMPVMADEVSLKGVEPQKIELPKTNLNSKQ